MRLRGVLLVLFSLYAATVISSAQTQTTASSPDSSADLIAPQKDANAQKAAELLRQTIKALGGQAYMSLQDLEQQGRTYTFYHGQSRDVGAPFWRFWKWPDKERVELTKQRDVVYIHNGDKGYEITFRGTAQEQAEPLADFLRRRHHSLENVLRTWLPRSGTALFYDGAVVAEQKPAEAVSIFNADNEQLTVYLDRNTNLPIKKSFTWRDPKARDRNQEEEIYDNYKEVQGIMTPYSITRKLNGEMLSQRFIDAVRYNQNLPDTMFDASITWDPYKRSGPRR
jgi:hypothetical protein